MVRRPLGLTFGVLLGCFAPFALLPLAPETAEIFGIWVGAASATLALAIWVRWPIAAGLLLGFACAWASNTAQLADVRSVDLAPSEQVSFGRVISMPNTNAERTRFEFAPEGCCTSRPMGDRWQLTHYQPRSGQGVESTLAISAGDYCYLRVRIRRPHGGVNPAGSDYEGHTFRQGIDAVGYIRRDVRNTCSPSDPATAQPPAALLANLAGLRAHGAATVTGAGSRGYERVLRALLLGDRSGLQDADWTLLRQTGTVHLVVVSGLHISLVAALGLGIAGGAARLLVVPLAATGLTSRHLSIVALCFGLTSALAYALLAGFTVPTQRAWLMAAIGMTMLLLQRRRAPVQTLYWAALGVLLLQPLAWLEPGFWLSFLAVSALMLTWLRISAPRNGNPDERRENSPPFILARGRLAVVRWGGGWLRAQALLLVVLTPVLLLVFDEAPLLGPVANLLAVPLVTALVLPLGLAGLLVKSLNHNLSEGLLNMADASLALLWHWLELIHAQTGGALIGGLSLEQMVLLSCAASLILLPIAGLARVGIVVLLAAMAVLVDASPNFGTRDIPLREARVVALDVGQGLATVVLTRHHAIVIDPGPRFGNFDAGARVTLPTLQSFGVPRPDLIVVSHRDTDHAGGLSALLEQAPLVPVVAPRPGELRQFGPGAQREGHVSACRTGATWTFDGVQLVVLSPSDEWAKRLAPRDANNHSCVVLVMTRTARVLLPGDIHRTTEAQLVRHFGQGLRADLLLVPHHGSKSSSSVAFVAAVRARDVIYSAAAANRFGHPHPQVVHRYRQAGARAWNTGQDGAISWDTWRASPVARRGNSIWFWHHIPDSSSRKLRATTASTVEPALAPTH